MRPRSCKAAGTGSSSSSSSLRQPVDIEGVPVLFPFEAYPSQIHYMQCVVRALDGSKNALLESPTGTGKTLSLLCSALAWQKKQKEEGCSNDGSSNAVVIYASRTHSQLSQVLRELHRTAYGKDTRVALLGSREQLCVHPKLSKLKGGILSHQCGEHIKRRSCSYFLNAEKKAVVASAQVADIEDLAKLGKRGGLCPYYSMRYQAENADLVLLPYNYLLDPASRRGLNIPWLGSILIFDEGHNLESSAADAASFEMDTDDLAGAQQEVKKCESSTATTKEEDGDVAEEKDGLPVQTLRDIQGILWKLRTALFEVQLPTSGGCSKPGVYIMDLLATVGLRIDDGTAEEFLTVLEQASKMYMRRCSFAVGEQMKMSRLDVVHNALLRVFQTSQIGVMSRLGTGPLPSVRLEDFMVHINSKTTTNKDADRSGAVNSARLIHFWCFNPGLTMHYLKDLGVRSIIVTSGTLSPLDSVSSELGLEFDETLENPHVINNHQALVTVCQRGPTKQPLRSSWVNRSALEYKKELGYTLINFFVIIPAGVLVFFPTYLMMEDCIATWKQHGGIWARLGTRKHLVSEPRRTTELKDAFMEYNRKVDEPDSSGAAFFAVCKGKISEGMDFPDDRARCVIIIGIPFPPLKDPKVALKRKFLDKKRLHSNSSSSSHIGVVNEVGGCSLSGDEWYSQSASRAVNQAIGRIVRHRYDFGCVVLCDDRFGSTQQQKLLSSWARPYLSISRNFAEAFGTVRSFFSTIACDTSLQNFAQSQRQLRREKHPSSTMAASITTAAALTEEYIPQSSVVVSMRNASRRISVNGSYIPPSELADAASAQQNMRANEELKLQEWRLREAGRREKMQANGASKLGQGVTCGLFASSSCPTGMESEAKVSKLLLSRAPEAAAKIFPKGDAVPSLSNQLREAGGVSGSRPMPSKTTCSDFPITITRKHGNRVLQSLKFGEKNGNSDGVLYANLQPQEPSVNGAAAAASKEAEDLTIPAAANNSNPCCDRSERSKQQAKRIGREFLLDARSQLSRQNTEEFAQLLRSLRSETLNAEQGKVSTEAVKIVKSMMQLLGKTDAKLNLCARLRDVIPACFSGHFKAIYVQQSAMLEAKARKRNRGLKRPSPSSALQHVVDSPVMDSAALRYDSSGPSPSRKGGVGDSSGYLCTICCEIANTPVAAKLCGHVLCSQCWALLFRQATASATRVVCPACRKPVEKSQLARLILEE